MNLDFILKFGVVGVIIFIAAWITERLRNIREREVNATKKEIETEVKSIKQSRLKHVKLSAERYHCNTILWPGFCSVIGSLIQ